MSKGAEALDFEKDLQLTEEDVRALERSRIRRVDPTQLKWEWISLGAQFPNIDRDRPTSEGWVEFEL